MPFSVVVLDSAGKGPWSEEGHVRACVQERVWKPRGGKRRELRTSKHLRPRVASVFRLLAKGRATLGPKQRFWEHA